MRIARGLAALLLIGVLATPSTAAAVDWAEWRRLIRHRPVAVIVAIPPLILTSPFMLANWLISGRGEKEDE